MELLIDTHTHTIVSGHAFSTIYENIQFAKKRRLQGITMTEHGPKIEGAQPVFIMWGIDIMPREYDGIRIYRGTEADIDGYDGSIDIYGKYLKVPEFVIASLHEIVLEPGTKAQNTSAVLGALNNPYVDIIGHPGNPEFETDLEAVVNEAAKLNKLLEINNHSFEFRHGSEPNCRKIIKMCKQKGVRICVGSDAHVCFHVGSFDVAKAILEEENFPEELIVSRNKDSFEAYLSERAARIGGISR